MNNLKYATISDEHTTYAKKWRANAKWFNVQFNGLDECTDIREYAENAFGELIDQAFKDAKPQDEVGIQIK